MSAPLGYLLTWTCYGTWLHGDSRESVDRRHNQFAAPRIDPDPHRAAAMRSRLRYPSIKLDHHRRQIVTEIIRAHCSIKDWTLHALNVRSNHVHVVVSCPVAPKLAIEQFHAWCTRRMRERGLLGPQAPLWTPKGSGLYLWKPEHLADAIRYVSDLQGEDLD